MRLVVFLLFYINIAVFAVFVASPGLRGVYNDYVVLHKHDLLKDQVRKGMGVTSGNFHPVQLVGSMFGHDLEGAPTTIAGKKVNIPFHLLLNMFVFIMFVPMVREAMSRWSFLLFYLFAGIFGGVLTAFLSPSANPVVGASGALCGVVTAFAWYAPWARLMFLPIPLPIKSRVFVGLFFLISCGLIAASVVLDPMKVVKTSPALHFLIFRISHFGHAAGMVAAALFLVGLRLVRGGKALKALPKPAMPEPEKQVPAN